MSEFVISLPVARFLARQPIGSEYDVDVVPGLRHDVVQSFDLMVAHAATTALHTVVVGSRPMLSDHDRAVIAQALAATRRPVVVFLVQADGADWTADCAVGADSTAVAAAVGVTVGAARGADSASFGVFVHGSRYSVTAQREGQRWRCAVGQAAPFS